jgi:hypothetical protein
MAGTLIVSAQAVWMPAGWAFDLVLETLADDVEAANAALARRLRDARTEVSVGFLDLSDLDAGTLAMLHQAVGRAHQRFQRQGPSSFHNPDFFPGFMAKLEELQRTIGSDPRLAQVRSSKV